MKRIRRCFFLAASPLCSVLIALHFLGKINIPLGAEQSTTGETNLAVAKIESSALGDKSFFSRSGMKIFWVTVKVMVCFCRPAGRV